MNDLALPLMLDVSQAACSQAYGSLTEGMHLTGYTFERACQHLEWLLEGDRWHRCGDFKDVNAFLASLKFDRFRTAAETRARIANRIKELQPQASNRTIAATLGVAPATVDRDVASNEARAMRNAKNGASPSNASASNVAPPTLSGEDAAKAAARAAVNKIRGTLGTGETEWFTPPQYIEAARVVIGEIDLDPASHAIAQETIRATRYLTADDDGLAQPWAGRVWLNPPYAQPLMAQFIAKLIEELSAFRVREAILLTHNYTDTAWFHEAEAACNFICFTRGRIKFVDVDGAECAPTQGQAFFYYGPNGERFCKVFGQFGFVR